MHYNESLLLDKKYIRSTLAAMDDEKSLDAQVNDILADARRAAETERARILTAAEGEAEEIKRAASKQECNCRSRLFIVIFPESPVCGQRS